MKVITDFPVAYDSPDHIYPWGTARDNTTDIGFIEEIESFFSGRKIKVLDIGCSGGQLVIDFLKRGHDSIGIEGSDYSVKTNRANWPEYYNKNLFTCDATKKYEIVDQDNNTVKFDLITAWEVIEHIKEDDLELFFGNIIKHMKSDSIFCASIAPVEDIQVIQCGKINGIRKGEFLSREKYESILSEIPDNNTLDDSNPEKFISNILHQTVYNEEFWSKNILPKFFDVQKLPFKNKVRYGDSFHVMLKLKK
jgi:SAM-dependent methyltransferase